jgi:hypothetical protein
MTMSTQPPAADGQDLINGLLAAAMEAASAMDNTSCLAARVQQEQPGAEEVLMMTVTALSDIRDILIRTADEIERLQP